jgi:hypothetical protein
MSSVGAESAGAPRRGAPAARSCAAGRRGSRTWRAARRIGRSRSRAAAGRAASTLALASVADALALAVVLAAALLARVPVRQITAPRRLDAVLAEHAVARAAALLGRRRGERRRHLPRLGPSAPACARSRRRSAGATNVIAAVRRQRVPTSSLPV